MQDLTRIADCLERGKPACRFDFRHLENMRILQTFRTPARKLAGERLDGGGGGLRQCGEPAGMLVCESFRALGTRAGV